MEITLNPPLHEDNLFIIYRSIGATPASIGILPIMKKTSTVKKLKTIKKLMCRHVGKTGCDIVWIPSFQQKISSSIIAQKLFTPYELQEQSIVSLAGMFAAKEAVIKALGLTTENWHAIEIHRKLSGKPMARLSVQPASLVSHDLSISHAGDYAIAVFYALIKTA